MIKNSAVSPPISADDYLVFTANNSKNNLALNFNFKLMPFGPTFCSAQRISRVKSHLFFSMPRTTQNCKLLMACDFVGDISFFLMNIAHHIR